MLFLSLQRFKLPKSINDKIKAMKKKLLFLMCALVISTFTFAKEQVPLTVSGPDDSSLGNGHPKSPIEVPLVYIEDYTLLFAEGHPDYVLNIKDEDGDVVYTTTVYESMTQVVLPSTLSGDYEVELIMGNWIFMGYINL